MQIDLGELSEEEVLMILESRIKNKNKKEKSFFKKYILNRYVWYDIKQAVVRETIKAMFLIYIIEKFQK